MSQEIVEEIEALHAIYGDDFYERPPVWNVPSFAIRICPTKNSQRVGNEIVVIVRFKLSTKYPKAPPIVEVEHSHGLTKDDVHQVSKLVDEIGKANINKVMCLDIIIGIQSFLENQQFVPETFYDAMIRKEKEKLNFIQNLREEGEGDTEKHEFQEKSNKQLMNLVKSKGGGMHTISSNTKLLEEMNKKQMEDLSLSILQSARVTNNKKKRGSAKEKDEKKNPLFEISTNSDVDNEHGVLARNEADRNTGRNGDAIFDYSRSRYLQEFDEIDILGNGASGEVWKVRHKLDKRIYAVKKINLNHRNNSLRQKIKREVTTIASLFHKNIVRYYAAWMEQYEEKKVAKIDGRITTNNNSKSATSSGENVWFNGNPFLREAEIQLTPAKPISKNHNDESILCDDSFHRSGEPRGYGYNPLYDQRNPYEFDKSSSTFSSSTSSNVESETIQSEMAVETGSSNKSSNSMSTNEGIEQIQRRSDWLFIQMEFCHTTLRKVIDEKDLWKRPQEIQRLLREMLEALAYIHERKVIHRDLKPANIFLDGEGNIKLGDFGLATRQRKEIIAKSPSKGMLNSGILQSTATLKIAEEGSAWPVHVTLSENQLHNTNTQEINDETLTVGIGTALYRAPEQESLLHGNPSNLAIGTAPYDEKADIYSLGIILFEMCHSVFSTGMERLLIIKKIREAQEFPKSFASSVPTELFKIVEWLTKKEPKERPSARELLSSDLLPSKLKADSKYMRELNEELQKPNSALAGSVLTSLFQKIKYLKEYESSSMFVKDLHYNSLSYYIQAFQKDQRLLTQRIVGLRGNHERTRTQMSASTITKTNTNSRDSKSIVNSLLYLNMIKRKLTEIFVIHGAIDYSTQYLDLKISASEFVYSTTTSSSSQKFYSIEYLDHNGQVILLPTNLISPFARFAAFSNLLFSVRYAIDTVYSTDTKLVEEVNGNIFYQSHQPDGCYEAVFDIIVPANSMIQSIFSEYEILSVALSFLEAFDQMTLGVIVRIAHPLITEAIIGFCLMDWNKSDRGYTEIALRLKRVLTYCTDVASEKELLELIEEELKLSPMYTQKIFHIAKALINQSQDNYNCLDVLKKLEQAFFDCIDINRVLKLDKTAVKPDSASIGSPPNRRGAQVKRDVQSALTSKKIDITEINWKQVGVKKNVKSKAKKIVKPLPTADKSPDLQGVKVEFAPGIGITAFSPSVYDEEVKKYAKSFNRGVKHLRYLLELFYISGSNKDQLVQVVLDFGIDTADSPRSFNIFRGKGVQFLVEAIAPHLAAKASFDTNKTAACNPVVNLDLKGKNIDLGLVDNTKLTIDSESNQVLRRRYKKNSFVIISGGHYEHVINEYKQQFSTFESWNDSVAVCACSCIFYFHNIISMLQRNETGSLTNIRNIAMGVPPQQHSVSNFSLPVQLQVLVLSSTQLISMKSGSVSPVPDHENSSVAADYENNAYGISYKPYYLKSIVRVLENLRKHRIVCSGYISQLHGYQPHLTSLNNFQDILMKLQVSHLIVVDGSVETDSELVEVSVKSLQRDHDGSLTWKEANISIMHLSQHILSTFEIEDRSLRLKSQTSLKGPGIFKPNSKDSALKQAVPDEKLVYGFYPIVNYDSPEFSFLVPSSVNPGQTRESSRDNNSFNSKKKRKDIDNLFTNVILRLSVYSSDVTQPTSPHSLQQYQLRLWLDINLNPANSQFITIDKTRNLTLFKLIFGIEISFTVLRAVNSLLMNAATFNNVQLIKNELNHDHFLSSYNVTSGSRKLIKHYFSNLVSMSNQLVGSPQLVSRSSNSATSFDINRSGGLRCVLYTYSLIDDMIDVLYFAPEILINLKSIL